MNYRTAFIMSVISAALLLLSAAAVMAASGAVSLPRTGQTVCSDGSGNVITCAGSGQDGEKLAGNPWPQPRFSDNLDGSVTDNLTGLVWLRNANCFGSLTWNNALTAAAGLASGACGLADGSKAGDWRMPNMNELRSVIDRSRNNPALTAGHPFLNVENYWYWSGTTSVTNIDFACLLSMVGGSVSCGYSKGNGIPIWPVRSGQ